jgi:anti-anti-sigma factor
MRVDETRDDVLPAAVDAKRSVRDCYIGRHPHRHDSVAACEACCSCSSVTEQPAPRSGQDIDAPTKLPRLPIESLSMSSPFQLTTATVHGVPLIRLSGDLTFDQNVDALQHAAAELRAAGHTLIVFELTDVAKVDSTGIGALVSARQIFGAAGRIVLLRTSTRLRASLDVIHVTALFELVDNENDLRAALTRDGGEKP